MLLTADTVATGAELLRPGWIELAGPVVAEVGAGTPTRVPNRALGAVTVVPGFVDMHVHGGAGADFSAGDPAATAAVARHHLRHGTTTLLASLVTAGPDELLGQLAALGEGVRTGVIAGIHLEGPWLSAARCGAHQPALVRDPEPAELAALLDAAGGGLRMLTLAPERTGALDAITHLVDAGVVVAVGHTDATYRQTRAAISAGATVGTHVFNAMRPIDRREPGPIVALLEDPAVTVEVIADGVHLDPAVYRHVVRGAGPDRVALVTDAMAASGRPDGEYRLGQQVVVVDGGVARLAGTGTIAGGTATMDRVFRFAVTHGGLPWDEALLSAVGQSCLNPARALGLPSAGLVAGAAADLVVLDESLAVTDAMRAGEWIAESVGGRDV